MARRFDSDNPSRWSGKSSAHHRVAGDALARTIYSLLITTFVVTVAVGVWSPRRAASLTLCAFVLIFELFALVAVRYGHPKVAKKLLITGLTIPISIVVVLDGMHLGGAMTALLGLVVMSSWLLGRRASFIATGLVTGFILVSAALMEAGIHVPRYFQDDPLAAASFQILVVTMTAVPLINFLGDLRMANEQLKLSLAGAEAVAWSTRIRIGAEREEILQSLLSIRGAPGESTTVTIAQALSRIHPDELEGAKKEIFASVANKEAFRLEYRVRAFETETRWFQTWGKPYQERDAVRFLGLTLDVTKRKKAELEREVLHNKLAQGQKMDALAKLVRGVSHELGNNLCAIMLQAGNMAALVDNPELRRQSEMILAKAEEGAMITQRLSAFSKQNRGAPQPINLKESLLDMQRVLRHIVRLNLELRFELDSDSFAVIDPVHLLHIVTNLVANAQDAAPNDTTITVALRDGGLKEFGRGAQHCVVLSVSDAGHGIPQELHDRIFEPFFTTKSDAKAAGLGLSEVYGLVEQASGKIEVESAPMHGATFNVYLPIWMEAASASLS